MGAVEKDALGLPFKGLGIKWIREQKGKPDEKREAEHSVAPPPHRGISECLVRASHRTRQNAGSRAWRASAPKHRRWCLETGARSLKSIFLAKQKEGVCME